MASVTTLKSWRKTKKSPQVHKGFRSHNPEGMQKHGGLSISMNTFSQSVVKAGSEIESLPLGPPAFAVNIPGARESRQHRTGLKQANSSPLAAILQQFGLSLCHSPVKNRNAVAYVKETNRDAHTYMVTHIYIHVEPIGAHTYVYIYIYICMSAPCIHIYIYLYISTHMHIHRCTSFCRGLHMCAVQMHVSICLVIMHISQLRSLATSAALSLAFIPDTYVSFWHFAYVAGLIQCAILCNMDWANVK